MIQINYILKFFSKKNYLNLYFLRFNEGDKMELPKNISVSNSTINRHSNKLRQLLMQKTER